MCPAEASGQAPRIVLDNAFVLDGPRLADAACHRRIALDPDAARFFGWTVDQARALPDAHYEEVVRQFMRGWATGARLSLTIRRRSDDAGVGMVELRPRPGDEADVSYVVVPELRGRGVASRAVVGVLDWAARELGLRHAVIHCDVDNTASQRVAEKCGFVLEGRFGDELRFRRDMAPHEA